MPFMHQPIGIRDICDSDNFGLFIPGVGIAMDIGSKFGTDNTNPHFVHGNPPNRIFIVYTPC